MYLRPSQNLAILCLLAASTGAIYRKSGWLDRVVQYNKDNFIKDLQKLPAVEIHARIEKAPPGFQDTKKWDFNSVMRLISLLRQSKTGRYVHRALRRSMAAHPNRRIYMSLLDTYKYFPNIHPFNYYDDSDMESIDLEDFETTTGGQVLADNDVIIVSNPVEARLPSTKISVKMLRSILEERAFAARIMPPTTKSTIHWEPMSSTTATSKNSGTTEGSTNGGGTEGSSTGGGGTEGSSTEGGSSDAASTDAASTDAASTDDASTDAASTDAASTDDASTDAASTDDAGGR